MYPRSGTQHIAYFKRFKMEIDLVEPPLAPTLPAGFHWVPWEDGLLDLHADVLFRSFIGEIDAMVFPSLGNRLGCRQLMQEIGRKDSFVPAATWLIACQEGYCGTVQGLSDRMGMGAVQNLGVVERFRGRGLGTALILQALNGFRRSGLAIGFLEVTAQNDAAVRLYRRLGFRRKKTIYKPVESNALLQSLIHSTQGDDHVPQPVYQHTFPNGLTLLAERMDHVRSAALNFMIPAGCVYDPPGSLGIASVLADLISRGAGERDSRDLTLALDNLGLDRDESVSSMHTRFWAATVARNIPAALEIYADILLRPHLPEDEIEAVQMLALQDLQNLEDEPRQKVLIELKARHYPNPLGQDRRGVAPDIEALTVKKIREHYQRLFRPQGAILSVAGYLDWEPLRDQVGRLFGDWKGSSNSTVVANGKPAGSAHLHKETTQTQIALAYPSVPIGHPEYYAALGAVNVLSGGMSAGCSRKSARNAASVIRCGPVIRPSKIGQVFWHMPAPPTSAPRRRST
jgi:ribosomal protein S18 acetylase RimI-like enzyme